MSANILRLTCNDNVRPNYFFFLQFLRARISSSCFLQSETVFLAMVWGHAMHSLELAAAAPRLEQQSAGYILVSSPGQRLCPGWENVIRPNHHNWLLPAFFVSSSGCWGCNSSSLKFIRWWHYFPLARTSIIFTSSIFEQGSQNLGG